MLYIVEELGEEMITFTSEDKMKSHVKTRFEEILEDGHIDDISENLIRIYKAEEVFYDWDVIPAEITLNFKNL